MEFIVADIIGSQRVSRIKNNNNYNEYFYEKRVKIYKPKAFGGNINPHASGHKLNL